MPSRDHSPPHLGWPSCDPEYIVNIDMESEVRPQILSVLTGDNTQHCTQQVDFLVFQLVLPVLYLV